MKSLAISVYSFYKARRKYGNYFNKELDFLLSSDGKVQEQAAREQLEIFLKKIKAVQTVYSVNDQPDVRRWPVIDKQFVLKNYSTILRERPYITVRSSGTSGQPLAVPYNQHAYQKEYAFWWYHRSFAGIKRGDRVATIMGHKVIPVQKDRPPFWVMNFYENQVIFSSYHLSRKNLKYYIAKLNEFKPQLIHAYPSSIYLIARYILENNLKMEFIPEMIQTASETTLDFQRRAIEKAFNSRVYIWYGNTEYCGHITECPQGKLHVQPYHSYVRFVNEQGKDVRPGEEGFIVGTNFANTAFPLINYNTKDVARVSANQTCSCGRGGTIVDYISGRMEDYIITPQGRLVGRLDHLFKHAEHVRNAQLEQNRQGQLIIRIEKEDGYSSKIEQAIREEAKKRLGDSMEIHFDYVNEIPKNNNGKFKFIVQKLDVKESAGIG